MNKYVNSLYNTDDDLGVKMFGASTWNRLKARAAAASDARMGGCEMPVVINSGSGISAVYRFSVISFSVISFLPEAKSLFTAAVISALPP